MKITTLIFGYYYIFAMQTRREKIGREIGSSNLFQLLEKDY